MLTKPMSFWAISSGHFVRLTAGLAAALTMATMSGCASAPQDEFAKFNTDELYADAKDEAASGNYEAAIKRYEKLEARASGTVMAQQAQLDLAYAYYKTKEKALALAKIERFMRLNPSSPAMDYALYLQGIISFNADLGLFSSISNQNIAERDQQASRDAYDAFKQLVDRFPSSKYAPDARLRMNHIVNTLAAGEVTIARYYFKRQAYLAAANRAQVAISQFPNSPAAEEALFIMANSYEKLAMPTLKDDALRVLKTSFPNSAYLSYLSNTQQAGSKPWWQMW